MVQRIGQQIGNYRLLRFLGQGGEAQVYLGEPLHTGTIGAIKIFHEGYYTTEAQNKILAELQVLSHLTHPHVIRIFDYGMTKQQSRASSPYIVMSYVERGTLRDRFPVGTVMSLDQIVVYVNQVADALDYAHTQNIIHGDVKPENMLVEKEGHIFLSDFGIDSLRRSTLVPEMLSGTVMYMAPESLEGKYEPASDQYALGIVVYEWLSGSPPFKGVPGQIVYQHMNDPVPLLADRFPFISKKGIEQVVMKALNKDPKQRYSTVKEFAIALEHEEKVAAMTQKNTDQASEERRSAVSLPASYPVTPPPQPPSIGSYKPTEESEGLRQDIYGKLQTLSTEDQKEILIKAMGSLSIRDKSEVVQETGIRPLTQEATDFVWKVVVSGAVIVFVGSAVGIAVAVFVSANVAPLITVFTAAVAFLGGLLAPSPVQSAVRSLTSGFKSSSKADSK